MNFGEPWTLKSYCETHRSENDTTCFMKDAGNVFWFKQIFGQAITCKQHSKFIKIKGTTFLISIFFGKFSRLDFSIWNFSCIQNRLLLWEYGPTKYFCQKMHSHFEFLYCTAKFSISWKRREILPLFFETVKKSYIVLPHGNKYQIRNRCPHF